MSQPEGLAGLIVGDIAYTSRFGQQWRLQTVEQVGRKWITIGHTKYDIATGKMQGGYTGEAQTAEQHAAAQERVAVVGKLRGVGIDRVPASLSNDQLRRILRIATEPTPTEGA